MTGRQAMLERVRAALGRANAAAPSPPENAALVRRVHPTSNLAALFVDRAKAVGMSAVLTSEEKLAGNIADALREVGARHIAIEADVAGAGLVPAIEGRVRDAGIEFREPRASDTFAPYYALDAGVTLCPAVIAESGSLVVISSHTTGRGASLVPPVHIAVVRDRDILPDLVDLWPFLAARNFPASSSSFTLITGPSKTADIEGILITGVHGPREVRIFVVSGT